MPGPTPASESPEAGGVGIRQLLMDLRRLPRGPVVILVLVALCLTLLEYYGMPWHYEEQHALHENRLPANLRIRDLGPAAPAPPFIERLADVHLPGPQGVRPYLWWSLACLVLLVLVPLLGAGLGLGLSPRALGLRIGGTLQHARIYLLLFAAILPVLWIASLRHGFQQTYPYYRGAKRVLDPEFLLFELAYCAQFFAVEFFFRGFLVLGLRRWLGWASVLVMLPVYCMLHFHMPLPEALSAVAGGAVLGVLSFRTGTILPGWLLHCGIAVSMDLFAMYHAGLLY